jgi:heme oxygenase
VRQVSKTLVRLNVETRCFHALADAPWLELVAPGHRPTRLEYVQQLVATYGFDAALEAALAYTPHIDGFIDLHRRFRSGLLAADLIALGVRPGEVAELRQCMIAPFANVAEAFGWLYVHERATLLNNRVCRELVARAPEIRDATSALCAHQHLDSFGDALDEIARAPAIEDRIVAGALDAFRTLQVWQRGPVAHARASR